MKARALVTGGSRGIGAAVARALARAGHPVILNYRAREDAARAVQAAIAAEGGTAELCPFDVADPAAVAAALATLLADEARPIGVLVNNAGLARDGPFPALERDAWEAVTRTTLDGFYNVTRPLVMPMVRRRFGRIINISSVSGVVGNRGQVNYAAAKAGLIGFTQALAKEVGSRNVRANVILPGVLPTPMLRGLSPAQLAAFANANALGRINSLGEVARFVAFLAGLENVSGQVFQLDSRIAPWT